MHNFLFVLVIYILLFNHFPKSSDVVCWPGTFFSFLIRRRDIEWNPWPGRISSRGNTVPEHVLYIPIENVSMWRYPIIMSGRCSQWTSCAGETSFVDGHTMLPLWLLWPIIWCASSTIAPIVCDPLVFLNNRQWIFWFKQTQTSDSGKSRPWESVRVWWNQLVFFFTECLNGVVYKPSTTLYKNKIKRYSIRYVCREETACVENKK